MKTELKLHTAQRNELTRIAKNLLREEKFYDIWGQYLKGYCENSIEWYFLPFKGTADVLPPVQCDVREERDDKDNLINVVYKFKIKLTPSAIKDSTHSVEIEFELNKGTIDAIV